MSERREKVLIGIKFAASIVLAIVFLNFFISCSSDDSNPARNPDCGSGIVDWDSKGQVCRDRANGLVVPSSCCGR